MPRLFNQPIRIADDVIDTNGHTNNLAYLAWMQEIAIAHAAACGWTLERHAQEGTSWFIRSHFIEYLRPAMAGDDLVLVTWVAGFAARSSPRRYIFWRPRDQRVIAKAETLWVYVQAATGRPLRVPASVQNAFEVIEDEEEVLKALRARAQTA